MRIQISSSELSLTNYLCLRCFLYKVPQRMPPFLLFDVIADKVHKCPEVKYGHGHVTLVVTTDHY